METIYPKAQWRPLSNIQTEPNIGTPRLLIWHTMIGFLRGTEQMFRKDGYSGTESTFGLGGSWDGEADGILFQWQLLSRQADAQFAGNAYATSIECSDGGHAGVPFSAKQVATSIELGLWWCEQTGNPAAPAQAWNGHGLGYHSMFPEWNVDNHACPTAPRISQLRNEIWPEISHRLRGDQSNPTPPQAQQWPKFPLGTDDFYGASNNSGLGSSEGESGLRIWQRQMVARGWSLSVNGQFDDNCVKVTRQFQTEKGLGVDGRVGLHTWNAAWALPVTS
jgi:hypothetical protein